ncbi:ATP-binding cassette domain-containing protein [Candidatus Aalborgicola defluviihabitans]|uniref:ATP-binding cassette domain-containing protein n=1 Tax=Candidatus Aalborgicola defluviihabitans TaxID=3386187 RepID=UPI0039B9A8AA
MHDLSLNIPAGGFYGLVGHTGSGKSTLLSLLLRFYQAQTGRITVDGVELSTFSDAHFREDVGLVPQDPFLLASSVRDNIAMGRELDQAAIEEAARAATATTLLCSWNRATTPCWVRVVPACRWDKSSSLRDCPGPGGRDPHPVFGRGNRPY